MSQQGKQQTNEREVLLAEIGQRLRQARSERQQSIQDIAHRLKLRRVYIEALENGEWERLPGDAYAIGFLKQYAELLGLDLESEIQRLSTAEYRLTKPMTFPDPPIAPSRKWALWAGAAFVVLFILFNVSQLGHEHLETDPPTPLPESENLTPETEKAPVEEPSPPAPVPQPEAQAPQPETQPPANASESREKPASGVAAEAPKLHRFRFTAVGGDAWLEVYLPDAQGRRGERQVYRLLRKGETAEVETSAEFVLVTSGKPAALKVAIDGRTVIEAGELAPNEKVVRNWPVHIPEPPAH